MEASLNKSCLTDAYQVLKHVTARRPLSGQVLVRSEPGRISLVGTNGDIDVRYQAIAKENTDGAEFLVPLSTIAGCANADDEVVSLYGQAEAALAVVERLGRLADDPEDLAAFGKLFQVLNVHLFLDFEAGHWGKRKVRRLAGGMLTMGTVSWFSVKWTNASRS